MLQREIAFNEDLIRSREEGISRVQKEMAEIVEIFQDIGTLVTEHSDLLGKHYKMINKLYMANYLLIYCFVLCR